MSDEDITTGKSQPPQFREASEFVVTFRKAPALSEKQPNATSLKGNEPQQLMLDVLPEVTNSTASSQPERILDQGIRIAMAMRHIHERGSILNREYRELTGVSEQTALRDLEALVEQGILTRVGKTRSRHYKLP